MMRHTNSQSDQSPGAGRRESRPQHPDRAGVHFAFAACSPVGEQEERARLLVEMAELLDHNPFLDAVERQPPVT
jgi:hypothetical protein